MSRSSTMNLLAVLVAVVLHVSAVFGTAWPKITGPHNGRDFASYYYAARVAADGGDPYARKALSAAAREDGTRRAVHPFFYPPPFVVGTLWLASMDLRSAFLAWFWIGEISLVVVALVLALWWRELHPMSPAAVALLVALMTAIPNNYVMGQANLPVLALLLGGLFAERRGQAALGGTLVGLACMAKMAPALFVAWWILRRRWTAVGAALATAVVSSVVALLAVDLSTQVRFYTEVLPQFASGTYNGLTVPIDLFGNHSVPNLAHQLWPGGKALSQTAAWGSRAVTLALLAVLGVAFARPSEDPWKWAGQACAVSITMLLVPVYTYEHHLVWAIPAGVLVLLACGREQLPIGLVVVAGASVAVLCYDLQGLKRWQQSGGPFWVRELKFAALWGLWLCSVWIGRTNRFTVTPSIDSKRRLRPS